MDPVLPGGDALAGPARAGITGPNMSADDVSARSWLAWLVKVRIIIITFLLGIELAITRLTTSLNVPERLFISVILLWYTISVFFVVLFNMWREHRAQAWLQVVTDLAFATAVIYLTGGIDTWFNFLYPLIIIMASILLPRVWSYATALLSFILFGALLELSYFDLIHSYSTTHGDPRSLQVVIFVNLVAYLLIAYLAENLSSKLRQADVELAAKSGELEDLQALHENIINSMSGGLITTDLQGRVKLLNASGQKLLELSQNDVLGRPVTEFFLDKLPNVGANIEHGEVRCVTRTGKAKTFAVNVSTLAVPDRGEIGYVYALDDLTEVRRLEEEVRMRDRLAAIGRMASGIAHEIRNPLSSIAGSVQVLSAISELDEEQRSLVEIVVRESDRLNAIISDFLLYARDKSYKLAPMDLVPLLDDGLYLVEQKVNGAEIEIVKRFETSEAWALVDAERLRQAFSNIGERALRAMGNSGRLTVHLGAAGGNWQVRFADTSTSLTAQQMEKAFEPFQGNYEGGTGLGLAIVYQIIQGHGGKIWLRALPGGGAEFVLEFPQAARKPDSMPARPGDAVKAVAHG